MPSVRDIWNSGRNTINQAIDSFTTVKNNALNSFTVPSNIIPSGENNGEVNSNFSNTALNDRFADRFNKKYNSFAPLVIQDKGIAPNKNIFYIVVGVILLIFLTKK